MFQGKNNAFTRSKIPENKMLKTTMIFQWLNANVRRESVSCRLEGVGLRGPYSNSCLDMKFRLLLVGRFACGLGIFVFKYQTDIHNCNP